MRQILRSLLASLDRDGSAIQRINAMRTAFAHQDDDRLVTAASQANDLLQFMAITATAAARILRQEMFDVQLRGALALARGSVAEMQTGEGKTLAAVPAIAWFARQHQGVHVMTVNDYLARRDARWMGDIYRFLGLSVSYVQQGMTAAERRAAYGCDITYATANEIGFDLLRDVRTTIAKLFAPAGFNFGINCGISAGQTVAHAHIHVIPHYEGDVPNPRGGVRNVIPGKGEY